MIPPPKKRLGYLEPTGETRARLPEGSRVRGALQAKGPQREGRAARAGSLELPVSSIPKHGPLSVLLPFLLLHFAKGC